MFVKRIEIEEGFLDGLEVDFDPGLNVIIGPRGSGKTSLIELIRFCLAAPGVSKRSAELGIQQALSVLGSGQVTVTLDDDLFGEIVVTRTAEDEVPRVSGSYDVPLVFSQNEIESIGLSPKSRLNLLDGFADSIGNSSGKEEQLQAIISSLSVEMKDLSQEIDNLSEQIIELETAPEELKELELEEESIMKTVAETEEDQKRLTELGGILAALSVRASVFDRTSAIIDRWKEKVDEIVEYPPSLEDWPDAARAKSDLLTDVRNKINKSLELLDEACLSVDAAESALSTQIKANKQAVLKYDEEARKLRKRIESLKSGAGEIARRAALSREKVGQLSALQALREGKLKQLQMLQKKRKDHLAALDALRNERYKTRLDIAKKLNADLSPGIRISVHRSALLADYSNTLSSLLRGSGLHYTTLAPLLAQRLSPRELTEAVELDDVDLLAEHGEIQSARAGKLVSHLKSQGLEKLLTCTIEDAVDFSLLDGTEYKSSEHSSMGQRCTIILPILLRRYSQPLILDQPEDHLDNAFIVETLIHSIVARKEKAQLILATHNANIPVLGGAEQIIFMGSDGENGFIEHSGALETEESVEAITRVMEGGMDAFHRRASFYSGEEPE